MSNKNIIKENFSRYAAYYDNYSVVQNRTALKLIDNFGTNQFGKILDIGCGTGNYTRLLRNRFPHDTIKALDISTQMLSVAQRKLTEQRIQFVIADAETVVFDEKFDLITSNACFQWFANLDRAIIKYRDVLEQGGTMLFSTFGPLTFCELMESLTMLFEKDVPVSSSTFIDKASIKEILEKHFGRASVADEIIKQPYTSMRQLLNTIKYTGTRGIGINSGSITRHRITKLEKLYKEKFGAITATYQVFYCKAQKED